MFFVQKGHQVLVTEMMANYEHICLAKPDVPTPPPGKRKPFIVIEGNHRPSKYTIYCISRNNYITIKTLHITEHKMHKYLIKCLI